MSGITYGWSVSVVGLGLVLEVPFVLTAPPEETGKNFQVVVVRSKWFGCLSSIFFLVGVSDALQPTVFSTLCPVHQCRG